MDDESTSITPWNDLSKHLIGVDVKVPSLSDAISVGVELYEIENVYIRESALNSAAAQLGMDKSQLKHLVSLYSLYTVQNYYDD